jgi:hypothetical protein
VPEIDTDCGLPLALSVMLSEAVRAAVAEGVKSIALVHVPPAATDEPQVLVSVKSAESAPAKAMLVMLKAALPVLFRVTVCGELTVSTDSFPNARLEGESLAVAPVLVPVPERLTVWGLPVAVSVKVTAAVRVPVTAGVKVTLLVQLPPAATLDPQLLLWAKSLGFVPESAMLEILKAALPVLFRVMV